ncbi:hypothetical protein LRAMOSA01163 [Lichtheimia ramosa]|uniref:Alpha 1,2-mannosyltransferase n=1 Tax=Lichtheimia ramosa TaxID=688394 RepID=A0A077W8R7_9FUNG|nr:hypothetical protein LRAMOSA01163 [Lichtheimia ramosa]
MRRNATTYFTILSSLCLFYFGSLYIVSHTSSKNTATLVSSSCYSIMHGDNGLNKDPTSIHGDNQHQSILDHANNTPSASLLPNESSTTQPITNTTSTSERANAVIVILCRNNELNAMRRTMREFEDRFNRQYQYPYVFLNDENFTDVFQNAIRQMTTAKVEFGLVPESMWSVPSWVNQEQMNERLADYQARGVMYGGSVSYRHMCRFNSGFFYHHPLLASYDYYWRVEPGVHFYCDIDYDPFVFMQQNNKSYGFTVTLEEIPATIPTIWEHTLRFAHAQGLNTTLLRMFTNEQEGYNLCHFWSNFEIASLNLWRDERYQHYFEYLDSTGNFYYERWGDAIVHSLAAGLFLDKSQVHFFKDIGYKHDNFAHCIDDGLLGKCMCPEDTPNFDYAWGSCLPKWDAYPEQGVSWDFRPNGDQIIEKQHVVHHTEFVSSL